MALTVFRKVLGQILLGPELVLELLRRYINKRSLLGFGDLVLLHANFVV